jgi:molecular chaperone Hsp33
MNSIRRFLFKELDIRGQHLSINSSWQQIIENRGYSKLVRQLFGELSALAIMLANGMKHKGKLTMQIQGDGIVSLLLVEVTHDLKIRGMVRSSGSIDSSIDLDKVLGKGQIVATLYNSQTEKSFQSLVPRNPKGLIKTFEDYFSQSEQLSSKLWISSTKNNLSAVLIQKLPDSKQEHEDDWGRVVSLAKTITNKELCKLSAESLLYRLFNEEIVELFPAEQVYYECLQEREKFEKIVFDLGEQDARDLLKERGEITIHNEICNTHVFFNEEDLDRIFVTRK